MSFGTGSSPTPLPSPAPVLTPTPDTPVPTPTPGPGEVGPFGPPDASTTALSDAMDEPILTDIESGADQLLSTAVRDGLPDPYGPSQDGWATSAQDMNAYTAAPAPSAAFGSYTGADLNPYTRAAASDSNGNAFTGGGDAWPFAPAGNTRMDMSAAVASNGPVPSSGVPAGFPANARLESSETVNLIGKAPGGTTQFGDTTYVRTDRAVTINGVTYDAYTNDTVHFGQVILVPSAAPAPAAPTAIQAAVQPAPGPQLGPGSQLAPPPVMPNGLSDSASAQPGFSDSLLPIPRSIADLAPSSPIGQWIAHSNLFSVLQNDKILQSIQLGVGAVAVAAASAATGGFAAELTGSYLFGTGATALGSSVLSGAAGGLAGGAIFRYGVAAVAGSLGAPLSIGNAAGAALDPGALSADALFGAAAVASAFAGANAGQYWAARGQGLLNGLPWETSAPPVSEQGTGPASPRQDLPSLPAQEQTGGRPSVQGPPRTFVTSAESADQLLQEPPDPSAVSSGSHVHYVTQSGRRLGAQGWWYPRAGSARATGSAAIQRATTGGAPGLHGAHLYADRGGGAAIGPNIVPFSEEANLSSMKIAENAIAEYAASGRDVYLQVYARYADEGAIPAAVTYRVWTPGPTGELRLIDQFTVDFDNNLIWTEPSPPHPTVH